MDFFIIFIAFDLFFFCLFDFILEMATPLKQGRPTDWAWNYFTRVPVTGHKYFHAQILELKQYGTVGKILAPNFTINR